MKTQRTRKTIAAVIALFIFALTASAQVQFRKRYDFNGDGKADVALYSTNLETGNRGSFYIANSPNDQFRGVQWGGMFNGNQDAPTAGDFDGDGRGDFTVIRIESGALAWYILNSQATAYRRVAFGAIGDTTVPADYDGDGKDDIAVVRRNTSNNTFAYYWLRSSDGQFGGRTVSYATANAECRATLPGDYNGDGKADFVARCRQTATNQQYFDINDNAANTTQRIFWGIFTAFDNMTNSEGDISVPGDYDGDGKTDLAVVRKTPNSAGSGIGRYNWYIRRSSDGALLSRQYGGYDSVSSSGTYFDSPTQADYDGDGKTDIAVSRLSGFSLYHYIESSMTGTTRGFLFGFNNSESRIDRSLIGYTGNTNNINY